MSSNQGRQGRRPRPRGRGERAYARAYGPQHREIERMMLQAALEQGLAYRINYGEESPNVTAEEVVRVMDALLASVEQEQLEDQATNQRRRAYNDQFPGGNYRQPYSG